MQRIVFSLFLLCVSSLLVACGGGSGATPTVPAPPSVPGSGPIAAATGLLNTHADPVSYTSLGDIPSSGTATFEGYAYGTLDDQSDTVTDSLIGDLTVTVSFGNNNTLLTGSITNFTDENDDALTGTISLTDGNFDRSGNPSADPTIGVTISGEIVDNQSQTLSINGRLEGDFLSSNAAAMGGELLGTVSVNGERQNIDGGFIAER